MKVEKTHAKTVSDLLFRVEVIQEEKAHLAHRSRERERERERREKAHLAHRSIKRERERAHRSTKREREREREEREGTLGPHVHI